MAFLDRIRVSEWHGIEPTMDRGRLHARVTCHNCGAVERWSYSTFRPPESVVKDARRRGWEISRRTVCRACAAGRHHDAPVDMYETPEEPMTANITPIKSDASEAAKKAKRLVYAALEDYYDDAAKRYRPPHTDKTIAEELGVAEAFVKVIRETDFGPITPPDEYQKLVADMNHVTSELGKLRGRFDTLCGKMGWKS
jgi:hypothetical protein